MGRGKDGGGRAHRGWRREIASHILLAMLPPRKAARAPNTRFREFVGEGEPAEGALPLTHVTDAYALRDVVASGRITPQPCPVFGEPLLYLFYGRPAFRKNMAVQASRNSAYAPVCLKLHPPNSVAPCRMFPFDSGAFDANLFKPIFHNQMQLEDFGLEPDLSSARRLVRLFFHDNARYFHNTRFETPVIGRFDFEVQCYDDLVQKADEDAVDERLSAIELQLDGPVDLRSQVAAVVVPEPFMEDAALMTRLAELEVEPLPYVYVERWRPLDCTGGIYAAVREYYRTKLKVL